MARGRVVLATAQPILGSIVRDALAGDPALEIVAETSDMAGLRSVLRERPVDVVVVDVGRHDPTACLDVLEEHPRLQVLLIEADGRMAIACRMELQRQALGELSPVELREAVHSLLERVPQR